MTKERLHKYVIDELILSLDEYGKDGLAELVVQRLCELNALVEQKPQQETTR